MARVKDLDAIEPEQVNPANDLLHLVDVEADTSVDKKISVEKLLTKSPDAGTTARGYVNAGAQTFGGVKTFDDGLVSDDDLRINGDLNVYGDIYQNGQSYETHAEKLYTKKDMIITRDGANTGLASGGMSGIKAKKYDGTNDGILAFDNTGTARVGDEGSEEPLLTRSEESDLNNNDILRWDSVNKKATNLARPQMNNTYLKANINSTTGAVSYEWGAGGGAGVAFNGTRSAYEQAKLIPEGSDGFIQSGALVIITDENKTYVTSGVGSQQTLSLVSSIMRAETNSGITITNNQTIKADTVIFTGTRAEWEALSTAQKAKFNIVNITDEELTDDAITDTVEVGNMKAVTSNAVDKALHNSSDVFQGNQGNFVMPNGLIIKCGVCTNGSPNRDDWNVTFSKAFPNALFQVFVTPSGFSATCPNGWYTVGHSVSGFTIFCQGNAPGNGFAWLAIGT